MIERSSGDDGFYHMARVTLVVVDRCQLNVIASSESSFIRFQFLRKRVPCFGGVQCRNFALIDDVKVVLPVLIRYATFPLGFGANCLL